MSNRKIRVGELLKREISDILHTRFQGRAVMITITEVDVSPDNRNAKALYSVIETRPGSERAAQRFLDENKYLISRELSRRIILKYMPALEFVPDKAHGHANRVNELLDALGLEDDAAALSPSAPDEAGPALPGAGDESFEGEAAADEHLDEIDEPSLEEAEPESEAPQPAARRQKPSRPRRPAPGVERQLIDAALMDDEASDPSEAASPSSGDGWIEDDDGDARELGPGRSS